MRIDVHNKYDGYVRSYTPEQHGKDFESLAKEFGKKIGGKLYPFGMKLKAAPKPKPKEDSEKKPEEDNKEEK